MHARSLPQVLKLIMQQRGCSQTDLGRELGVSQEWVSLVIHGKRDPGFARTIARLAGVGWEVVIRPKREKSDPVKRREFAAAAASVMFIPSSKVGPYEDPAHVRELAQRLARARFEHGGGAIASTAIRHVRRIEPAVASGDRQLQEAASELAVEAVWAMNDACCVRAGENAGRLALKLAETSKGRYAQSQSYDALAALSLDHGNSAQALMYARQGENLRDLPDAQEAWMRIRKGWAMARVRGQEHAARDEIEHIWGLLQDAHNFAGPGRLSWNQ